MDSSFVMQRKRQHTWGSLPTVSQEQSDDTEMEIMLPPTKRSRLSCECYAASPDVVSDLDTLDFDTVMDVSSSAEDGECAVEWWKRASAKQGQQKLPMLEEDDLLCHVCDAVYKQSSTIASSSICKTAKPENSILAYFNFTPKTASKRKPLPASASDIQTTLSNTCTSCERNTCRLCLERCEKCQNQLCRLCIRNDFLGKYMRVLCLDCANDGLHEDTAMPIL